MTDTNLPRVKDWLVQQGHLTEVTRGRMSLENVAIVTAAYADGVRFDNWPNFEPTVAGKAKAIRDAGKTKGVKPTRSAKALDIAKGGTDTDVVEIAPYRYNLTTHAVYEDKADGTKGKRRSLKEVCANDGVSLVQCSCGAPKIVSRDGQGHVAVTIVEERSKPSTKNVWDK